MSELNLISLYEFNMSGAIYEIGFTDNECIYTKMMMIKKTAPLSTLSSIIVKKAPLTSKLQYDIKVLKPNGKEQIFQIIQVDSADPKAIQFVEELKTKVPPTCKWIDKLQKIEVKEDIEGKKKYSLQILWFIKAKLFAGKGRIFQIIINYGGLLIATIGFTLPLFIYVLVAGCHRVTIDHNGIKIKKLFSKFFFWEEVDRIEVIRYNIQITNYGSNIDSIFLLKFKLISKQDKTSKFIIRSLEGKQFVKEMIERGKIDQAMIGIFE